jgi:hypothetical protein
MMNRNPAAFWAACAQGGGIVPQIAALLWSRESADAIGANEAVLQCAAAANAAIRAITDAHANAGVFAIFDALVAGEVLTVGGEVFWETARSSRVKWREGTWTATVAEVADGHYTGRDIPMPPWHPRMRAARQAHLASLSDAEAAELLAGGEA